MKQIPGISDNTLASDSFQDIKANAHGTVPNHRVIGYQTP